MKNREEFSPLGVLSAKEAGFSDHVSECVQGSVINKKESELFDEAGIALGTGSARSLLLKSNIPTQ